MLGEGNKGDGGRGAGDSGGVTLGVMIGDGGIKENLLRRGRSGAEVRRLRKASAVGEEMRRR